MWHTPSGVQKKSSDKYIEDITRQPEDYRVLQRIPLDADKIPIEFAKPQDTDTAVVIVDVETTGTGSDDKVIELGMIRCRFDNSDGGRLVGIDRMFDMFEDPKEPLNPIITELTGITDEMVKGTEIDREEAMDMLQGDPIVLAHNARFDRPRFEKICSNDLRWRCTLNNIPWSAIGYGARSLEALLMYEGWFFDPHRAYRDCLATAWLLHCVSGSLKYLLEPSVKITALGDTFPIKETLKGRGYKWNPVARNWWTIRPAGSSELEYLVDLYTDGVMATETPIDPRHEYK